MPIGVFDSGLGGLTILGACVRALPQQDFVYLGDNANAPYGMRSPAEVYNLTVAGVERLFHAGCGLVILACNTASAVALHDLQVNWLNPATHRVLGVFVPVIEHLTRRDWGDNAPPTHTGLRDVALFATPATVRSGAFPRELRFRARDVTVAPQACTGLVEAIEAGDLDRAGDIAREHVAALLARLADAAVGGARLHPLPAGRGRLPRRPAAGDDAGLPARPDRRQPRRLPRAPPTVPRRRRRRQPTSPPATPPRSAAAPPSSPATRCRSARPEAFAHL